MHGNNENNDGREDVEVPGPDAVMRRLAELGVPLA